MQLLITQHCWDRLSPLNSLHPRAAQQLPAPFWQLPLSSWAAAGAAPPGGCLPGAPWAAEGDGASQEREAPSTWGGCLVGSHNCCTPKTSWFIKKTNQNPNNQALELLSMRVVGSLMRDDLNVRKAGSLALKAPSTKVCQTCPTDPSIC